MNWAWATSLDQLWRSPTFPMWLTLAAAGFFAVIVLITLLRAEKSVANGALTVITLLAIGIAVAATIRGFGPGGRSASGETRPPQPMSAALPALSCIDDLAGDTVLAACERALFGSAEVCRSGRLLCGVPDHAADRVRRCRCRKQEPDTRVASAAPRGRARPVWIDGASAERAGPLYAADCAAFRALTDRRQIAANMDERVYEGLIARYSPLWNVPAAATGSVAALASPSMPTGKPTNADFPTAASTPPVSIMTPEPRAATSPSSPRSPASNALRLVAPDIDCNPGDGSARAGGSQKAARAEATARAGTGPACAGGAGCRIASSRRACSGSVERLILSKAIAGR